MKKLYLFGLALILIGSEVFAKDWQPFSKPVITSYKEIAERWGAIAQKHPTLGQHMRDLDLKDSKKASSLLAQSVAKDELLESLRDTPFTSISQVLVFSQRFLAIQYYSEFKKTDKGINLIDMVNVLQANIDRMKANGASQLTVDKMEEQLAQHRRRAESIEYMLGLLSEQDKTFIDNNSEWLSSQK